MSALRSVVLACAAGAGLWPPAQAQSTPTSPPAPAPFSPPVRDTELPPVVITGNPLGRTDAQQASSVLTGDALTLKRAGTLGETLDGLPGVATSSFGPQSSRPVIRGLDGDRIRLLDNHGALTDASNLSFDHAVALDPLVVERIEVLRGPAALLYGGNATGGVVNTLDNRIPRTPLDGLGGRIEGRLGGAAREQAGAAVLEAGQGGLNWHADMAGRRSSDLHVPTFTPIRDGSAQPATNTVANSAAQGHAGALGASWADAQGFIGASVDSDANHYGVTVEPDVTIRMQRERLRLAGERRGLSGPFTQVEIQASRTRYRHEEIEGSGAVGTTFRSTGQELRLQAQQSPIAAFAGRGRLSGVVGLQAEQLDFAALGEEAFVPGTRTRSLAAFVLQELRLGQTTLSAGARAERSQVASDGDSAGASAPRFGPATQRRFAPNSLSLGLTQALAPEWTASATLGRTQRAPAYYELYANGLHVATGAYEVGDASLGLELSRQLDLGLQWKRGPHLLKANAYQTRFANYIALDASGASVTVTDDSGNPQSVPEYRFTGVPARLTGFELEGRTRVLTAPWAITLTGQLDRVRGINTATGEALPRLPPMRLQLGAELARGSWRGGLLMRHAAAQARVPANDVATGGYTMLDAWTSWATRLGGNEALWYLRATNLGNTLAYNAAALRTARDLSPLGGRALSAGLRVTF